MFLLLADFTDNSLWVKLTELHEENRISISVKYWWQAIVLSLLFSGKSKTPLKRGEIVFQNCSFFARRIRRELVVTADFADFTEMSLSGMNYLNRHG